MKLYSDTLTATDLTSALLWAGSGVRLSAQPLPRVKVRANGWTVTLGKVGSRRHFNTGTRGAGRTGAASWTEYGRWMARLYAIDPEARIGPYKGAADFHHATKGEFARHV